MGSPDATATLLLQLEVVERSEYTPDVEEPGCGFDLFTGSTIQQYEVQQLSSDAATRPDASAKK